MREQQGEDRTNRGPGDLAEELAGGRPGGLSGGLQRRVEALALQRDSLARLLERTERTAVREQYLASIHRLSEEIRSLQEALEYNSWLDDSVSRGPWVAVAITNVDEHNPMDGVHIDIVYEEPGAADDEIEIELTDNDPDV
ncbi:MAG: hypothetical protein JKY37_26715 [Nannocystaceae bacterium]|nr:hypothetical protein [Nannocystaceae bacterium]